MAVSLLVGLLVWSALACESHAVRSFRGGRLYVTGTEALDRGDATAAVRALEEAAVLVPTASEIRNHLGLAYQATGDRDRARDAFEAAIDLDCDNMAARSNLARLDAGPGAPVEETRSER
ncbi:MAG: tetratricopeptide repeat protein [bacterium]|nr:tetratricopeptide repeat protein [bacterium]